MHLPCFSLNDSLVWKVGNNHWEITTEALSWWSSKFPDKCKPLNSINISCPMRPLYSIMSCMWPWSNDQIIKTLSWSCAASELETFLAPADVRAKGRGHWQLSWRRHLQLSWRGQGTTDITWVTCHENLCYNNSAPLLYCPHTPCLAGPQPQARFRWRGPPLAVLIHTVECKIVGPLNYPLRNFAQLQIFEVKFANI